MLSQLSIRNFAIIERLELDLAGGLTVVTGETGAGKSIIIDALDLCLGGRGSADAVRHGADNTQISASFELDQLPAAAAWLAAEDLADDDECILRRVITAEGRSRAYINGSKVPLRQLQALGEFLVDIHGQHEHQSLLRREAQLAIIDSYGDHRDALARLAKTHADWRTARAAWQQLADAARDRDERLDYLRFQLRELDELAVEPDEFPRLNAEHGRLANADKLLQSARQMLTWLHDGEPDCAESLVGHAQRELASLVEMDPGLAPLDELLTGAAAQLGEAADSLRHYTDQLDLDPERLNWVDQRLGALLGAARKHRIEPEQLPEHHQALAAELARLDNAEVEIADLAERAEAAASAYRKQASKLSKARHKAATELAEQVTAVMQTLGLPQGQFDIAISQPDADAFRADGIDRCEFLVAMNPGQPAKPLAKVASGGELSRVSLAIQVIAAERIKVPTLVFDEVDTGIGGGVAEIVGRRLRALGGRGQVFCITHLPQVAAHGHQHLQVAKQAEQGQTATKIVALDETERTTEMARMLGGVELTDQSLAHAREMLARAAA